MSKTVSALPIAVDASIPAWKRVLLLAWPVFVQQMLLLSVGLWDQYLAGNNPPPDQRDHTAYQAAQTTANYINWQISSLSVLVGVGATALVARYTGARMAGAASRVANQVLVLATLVGLSGSCVGLLGLSTVIAGLRLEATAAEIAVRFLEPILLLLTLQMLESAGVACLVGAGDTRTGLFIVGGVALLNLPLTWLCFHGWGPIPGWGFVGIAMGTALSHTIGGLTVLTVLARGRAGLRLRLRWLLPNVRLLYRLLRISLPAGIDSLSMSLCQLWFLSLINTLGNVAATAHGIAIRWEALGYMSGHAFAVAAAALVGQNLGARQPREAARAGWTAFRLGCGVMVGMGVLFFCLAEPMFRLFCPFAEQAPVIAEGVPVLRLVAFAMPALAGQIILTGALRGAGDTRRPVLITWCGFLLVRLPLAYWLIADLGLLGAWIAMLVDLYVRGVMIGCRFASDRWQEIRV